jgi:crotonobetainyl-CoA:carnitine CoA-transferase CaiB-like acyl-CoA transferase
MPNDATTTEGLLSGIRVLDLSGYEGMYGARLLADLGADVVRVEGCDADRDVAPGPYIVNSAGEPSSAFRAFVNLNKRVVRVDLADDEQRSAVQGLVDASDIVLADRLSERVSVPQHVALVETSTFGRVGSGDDLVGSDLVGLAAGGLLSLGGYPDTAPVAVYGNQAYLCGGIMTGVAAVLALLGRSETTAPRADVSVQATLVGALEDATAEFDLRGTVRRRAGDQPREAGTGIFRSADGYIAIVAGKLGTAQAWLNLVAWLREAAIEGADELAEPEWTTLEKRRDLESLERFMEIFESFTTTHESEWLYQEGQARAIAIAPVNTMADVLADPQLTYRQFFRSISSPEFDANVVVPGKPYRLYDLPNFDLWSLARRAQLSEVTDEWSVRVNSGIYSRTTAQTRPDLSDVTVLDFCWIGAGSLVTQMLALHGAKVIKIESHRRPDNLRLSPPYRPGTTGVDSSGYFASRNANKKSFALNMSDERSQAIVHDLLEQCSVVTSNFRPGIMERWGLDYDSLKDARPDLISLSMPMQGEEGPFREYAGFGSTIAALSGLVAPSGLPERRPVGTGTNYPDHVPNPGHSLVAVLAAIYYRRRTGRGGRIELSQLESTVNMMGPSLLAYSVTGEECVAIGNRSLERCPQGVFRCQGSDEWIAISVSSDEEWRQASNVLGLDLDDAGRFATFASRKAREDEIEALIEAATKDRDARELMGRLQREGVPASVVNTAADVFSDDVMVERGYWHALPHEVLGDFRVAGPPFTWSDGDASPVTSAPLLGEHTREIWTQWLNKSEEQFEHLSAEGVLW